jgi:hypothetical protein
MTADGARMCAFAVAGSGGAIGYCGDRLRPAGWGARGALSAGGWFLLALPYGRAWLGRSRGWPCCAYCLPLVLKGWAGGGLWQVSGPLDDQAGSLVGSAGVFGFVTPPPSTGTSTIMTTFHGLRLLRRPARPVCGATTRDITNCGGRGWAVVATDGAVSDLTRHPHGPTCHDHQGSRRQPS